VIVALLERLHPRNWDGHRLLQFLTGLALLALAFSAPVAPAVAAPPPPAVAVAAAEVPTVSAEIQTVSADDASPVTRDASASEPCRHDAGGYTAGTAPIDGTAALAGAAQRVHGSRAPPRA
jgi:hypothetical protein